MCVFVPCCYKRYVVLLPTEICVCLYRAVTMGMSYYYLLNYMCVFVPCCYKRYVVLLPTEICVCLYRAVTKGMSCYYLLKYVCVCTVLLQKVCRAITY